MKKGQYNFVKERLLASGYVSRNECLRNYITRLGAIICKMNREGWVIRGQYSDYENGRDYVYYVEQFPTSVVERAKAKERVADEDGISPESVMVKMF